MAQSAALYLEPAVDEQFDSSSSPSVDQDLANPPNSASREIFRSLNVLAIRRSFPAAWAEYLRANFSSPGQVHRAFPGIDEKTCRDWWNGKRDPSGSFVAAVIASDPQAITILGRCKA